MCFPCFHFYYMGYVPFLVCCVFLLNHFSHNFIYYSFPIVCLLLFVLFSSSYWHIGVVILLKEWKNGKNLENPIRWKMRPSTIQLLLFPSLPYNKSTVECVKASTKFTQIYGESNRRRRMVRLNSEAFLFFHSYCYENDFGKEEI